MKAIMISIKPQWVEKILNGEKTIEIRKTKPKCELPCKVYIYCTMPNKQENRKPHSWEVVWLKRVVAEFTLNKVDILERDLNDWLPKNRYDISNELLKDINLNQNELWNYGQGKTLYTWHIDDLKIYDKPKELSEFKISKCKEKDCINCQRYYVTRNYCPTILERPPQSYCYVEELEND